MRIFKNRSGDGFTAYHKNGGKSQTFKNMDGSFSTYGSNGRKSNTYKNLNGSYTTTDQYGRKSNTYGNMDGTYTSIDSDGRSSRIYPTLDGDGYVQTEPSGGASVIDGDLVLNIWIVIIFAILLIPLFHAFKYMIPALILIASGVVVRLFFSKLVRADMFGVAIYISCGLWMSALLFTIQAMLQADYVHQGDHTFMAIWTLIAPFLYGVIIMFTFPIDDYPAQAFLILVINICTVLDAYCVIAYEKQANHFLIKYLPWIKWAPAALGAAFAVLNFLIVLPRRKR